MVSEFCLATVEYMERFRQRDGLRKRRGKEGRASDGAAERG